MVNKPAKKKSRRKKVKKNEGKWDAASRNRKLEEKKKRKWHLILRK